MPRLHSDQAIRGEARSVGVARAIWKGQLLLGKHEVPVKLYSAIEDRKIRFRLLHEKDAAPVEQHIVRKDTGKDVDKDDRRKAFPLTRETAVILQPEDLESLEPPESREIHLCRFVDPSLLSDQWYDRPYYLGPDGNDDSYFAFSEALSKKKLIGIARWTMRKKRYLGALHLNDGYLMMTTLRRAEQVLSFSNIDVTKPNTPQASELKLAEQLVASISGDFEPEAWQDDYRKRVQTLIDAKLNGKKITPIKRKRKAPEASLADALKASLSQAREKKVA